MHSWRVLILPFLDSQHLYEQYDFDEPWDGPNNSKLAERMPSSYHCPSAPDDGPVTNYVAVVGEGTAFPGTESISREKITDGTWNTLQIVEVADSGIHWLEPRDLDFGAMDFAINGDGGRGISSPHDDGVHVQYGDGTVRLLRDDTPEKTVRALLTIQGGEAVAPL